jgi:hypothetical protein
MNPCSLSVETTRQRIGSSDVPSLVVTSLKIAGTEGIAAEKRDEYALEAARVAANLVVDDGRSLPSSDHSITDRLGFQTRIERSCISPAISRRFNLSSGFMLRYC